MTQAAQRISNLLSLCVSHLALNPGVTATLLYVLTAGPASLRARVTSRVEALRDPARYAAVVRALKWLVVCGVVRHGNAALNGLALNSYRLRAERARWAWDKEVAVVTGGCSGIGALVVKRLASRGLRVAVLDIRQLPASLQGCAWFFPWLWACKDALLTCLQMRISGSTPAILQTRLPWPPQRTASERTWAVRAF